jgi:hypothetical protein
VAISFERGPEATRSIAPSRRAQPSMAQLLLDCLGDQPNEEEPEHRADEDGGQEAASRTERIATEITTGRWRSLASIARKALNDPGPGLFCLARPSWIRFHTSMISLFGNRGSIPWRALTAFNTTITLVNDGAILLTAFGRCAESAHGQFPI